MSDGADNPNIYYANMTIQPMGDGRQIINNMPKKCLKKKKKIIYNYRKFKGTDSDDLTQRRGSTINNNITTSLCFGGYAFSFTLWSITN